MLGKLGIYEEIGGNKNHEIIKIAILFVLNYSDNSHSLLDISDLSGIEFSIVYEAASLLEKKGLIEKRH